MATHVYEGMFIFDSNRYARDPGGTSGKIPELIKNFEGELLVSRLWEERRLAYPIKGHRKGTYWLTYFRLDSGQLAGLNRRCQINEMILRHLFLKVDPRIADALVGHAKGETAEEPADKEKPDKKTADKGDAPASKSKK